MEKRKRATAVEKLRLALRLVPRSYDSEVGSHARRSTGAPCPCKIGKIASGSVTEADKARLRELAADV